MDRGYRAVLSLLAAGWWSVAPGLLATPPPGPSITPSVQATPAFVAPLPPPPMMAVPVPVPGQGPLRGRVRSGFIDARVGEPVVVGGAAAERLARMSPEEREAFKRNLRMWQQIPPEERASLRQLADERNREEISNAIRESGLQLNSDEKEMFALRYLQERRKLEREIQEQAASERARRLPEMLERLRREFGPKRTAAPGGAPAVRWIAPGSRGAAASGSIRSEVKRRPAAVNGQ
jgi:hypothetical protein